jgi:hypothetical protein
MSIWATLTIKEAKEIKHTEMIFIDVIVTTIFWLQCVTK